MWNVIDQKLQNIPGLYTTGPDWRGNSENKITNFIISSLIIFILMECIAYSLEDLWMKLVAEFTTNTTNFVFHGKLFSITTINIAINLVTYYFCYTWDL